MEGELQILEIGEDSLFPLLSPHRATHLFASLSRKKTQVHAGTVFSFRSLRAFRRELAKGKYGLVAVNVVKVAPWNPHSSLRRNLGSLFKHLTCPAAFGPYVILFLARQYRVPAIAYDRVDTMLIGSENFLLFPLVRLFFKRELPQNKWQVFLATTPKNGDVSNIRRQPFFREALKKIRPLPLYIFDPGTALSPVDAGRKRFDVFYAGDNPKTTVRVEGMKVMERLREKGVRVDLSHERLSRPEFYRRVSEAWLTWSPEGSGWECSRHYEALIHGSVPVMNYPTIYRYKPLIDRRHGFYYGCEEDDLARVVLNALEDRKLLLEMIQAGREHLRQWYSPEAVLEYILEESKL